MVEHYRRRTPLDALAIGVSARAVGRAADGAPAPDEALYLCEGEPRGQIALRGDADDATFRDAVRGVLGVEPPAEPGHVAERAGVAILWLGPDEWLAVLPAGAEADACAALDEAFASMHALASDVSHSRGVIRLEGTGAREVIARGCSLDLHPSRFSAGRCAQSTLARCHVLIHQRSDRPEFDLYAHRSFMEYAWAWLADAAGPHARIVVAGE